MSHTTVNDCLLKWSHLESSLGKETLNGNGSLS